MLIFLNLFIDVATIQNLCQILLFLGCVDAGAATALFNLRKGRSLLIYVGGEKEQLMTRPYEQKIYVKARKGFIKLALEFGTPLVPMVGKL
jgi:2-acylglycerol O-acyltransferase 2